MATALHSSLPGDRDAEMARRALLYVRAALQSSAGAEPGEAVSLSIASSEDDVTVSRSVLDLLAQVLEAMADGHGVTVLPTAVELTTQQAAGILNVSRPFLIKLLEAGEIEHRVVGTHRRVRAASLISYMEADDLRRRRAADELSATAHGLGLT